jgi:hypothetical protein
MAIARQPRRAPTRALSRQTSPTRRSKRRQSGPDYDGQIKRIWRMCAAGRISFDEAGRWTDSLIKTRDGGGR